MKLGFEREVVTLRVEKIIPLKVIRPGTKDSKKYAQILSSVRAVGLVEAPVVSPNPRRPGTYLLLDGHLRLETLKDLGIEEVECLVSLDDETYTYNKRISRLAAVQEHCMIVRAIERGVAPERVAEALGLDITTIRRRFRMLDGICPEAIDLLKDSQCPQSVFDVLRQMAPLRQVEAAELMLGQSNFSLMFARALFQATPGTQLVDPRKRKPGSGVQGSAEQIARLERELAGLQTRIKAAEETYGVDNLHLTVARGYIVKLLGNPKLVKWLAQHRQEYLSEFQAIAEIDNIATPRIAAE